MQQAGKQDPGYYSGVNESLVKVLQPVEGMRFLEVGCGAGAFGKAMKEKGAAYYAGIEIIPEVAKTASTVLDEVVVGDVENLVFPFPAESFDYLVFGDVLEHLKDPWNVLKHCLKFLKVDGIIAASIPNVNNIGVIAKLMLGSWKYEDSGILDKTHLRFFTLVQVMELFQQAKTQLLDVQGVSYATPEQLQLIEALDLLRSKFNLNNERFKVEAQTFQWVVKAKKILA
ncbi:MAG: class I SAM-dependent methyltransferase [bacterium]|nr:class I SAM-dependent methyltransferase [bacterium]